MLRHSSREGKVPIYTYQCHSCGVQFDRRQSFSTKPLERCPECRGHVRRLLQPAGVIFKGSGWYSTDHRSSKSSTTGHTTSDKSESGKSDHSDD